MMFILLHQVKSLASGLQVDSPFVYECVALRGGDEGWVFMFQTLSLVSAKLTFDFRSNG